MPAEPDIIALALVDTLEQLASTRLVLSCALEALAAKHEENTRLHARLTQAIEDFRKDREPDPDVRDIFTRRVYRAR